MVETMQELPPPPPPPPQTCHRRPRVREVSSRFMSPVANSSSSSSGDLHLPFTRSPIPKRTVPTPAEFQSRQQQRPSSAHRQRHQELEPLCSSDENRPAGVVRSLDTALGLHCKSVIPVQRKQRSVKIFNKENGLGGKAYESGKLSGKRGSNTAAVSLSRLDTPIPNQERATSLRPTTTQSLQRSAQISAAPPLPSAAAKLLRSSGMSLPAQPTSNTPAGCKVTNDGASLTHDDNVDMVLTGDSVARQNSGSCPSSPLQKRKVRSQYSVPEADRSPTISANRLTAEWNCSKENAIATANNGSKVPASPCLRSLNFQLSGCEQSPSFSSRTNDKTIAAVPKATLNSIKMGGSCLPPLPSLPKLGVGTDGRRSKKDLGHQEEVHLLRLLQNHYLQWRFANAKAVACGQSQIRETETLLYSLAVKISELCDSVRMKRVELELLERTKNLSRVLDDQMPYLEEWSALEGDYLNSLSEVLKALSDATLQLPTGGNLKAEIKELEEALSTALKVMEIIMFHVHNFIPKAAEVENLTSELARLIGGERVLVEECADILSRTFSLQVEESSLRGQLIQFQQCSCCPIEG